MIPQDCFFHNMRLLAMCWVECLGGQECAKEAMMSPTTRDLGREKL
jgi:hypothetical protein